MPTTTDTTFELRVDSSNQGEPEWPTTSEPPVPMERFGKDHWSTFAYLECRAVDNRGMLDHRHMRCHGGRHPLFLDAYYAGRSCSDAGLPARDGRDYATRLKGARDESGRFGSEELVDHDDYDCIGNLVAGGFVSIEMPTADAVADCFRDARGQAVSAYGEAIRPSFLTGLQEGYLARSARLSLTERGREIASQLRAHITAGGTFHQFEPDLSALS